MTKRRSAVRVFSNLAVTLDGKIADRTAPAKPLGTPYDRKMMGVIRKQAEVVIFGAETLRAMGKGVKFKNKKGRYLVNAVVSGSGNIDPDHSFWKDAEIIRFIFTTEEGYRSALMSSKDRAFIVVCGKTNVDPKIILSTLVKAGFTQILVEGGGKTIRSFIEVSCLNEMYVTVTPKLMGGVDNPGLVGGASGLQHWVNLKVLSLKRVKDEIYLHYRVK